MKKKVEEKLILMNKGLKAPKDAEAHLEQSRVIVTKSIDGKQYDVASLLKDYQKKRILVFLNPQLDILGSGYNVIQ
jgi:hypothetical protein